MRRNLPQIFRHLRELAEHCGSYCDPDGERLEILTRELRDLEKQKWGPRKKKKHKAVEGEHGDGI
jgi:hypothetical protein